MPSAELPCIILAIHSGEVSKCSDNLLRMSCGRIVSFRPMASRGSLFIVLNSSSRRSWSAYLCGDVLACEEFSVGMLLSVSWLRRDEERRLLD